MGKFFNYDSPIMSTINKVVDCFFLSLLWLVFSIPLVTIGASTTALYYTVNKVIRHDRSSIWKEFWGSFKQNFKQATIVWLILCVLYYILITNCIIMYRVYIAEQGSIAVLILYLLSLIILMLWTSYLFPYIARFTNTTKNIMKISGFLFVRHLLTSLLLVVLFTVALVIVYLFFPAIFLVPAFYMLVAGFLLENVFKRYMSDEDLAAEEERNRVYYN
jgi:uncharacterized membrane protein YesL